MKKLILFAAVYSFLIAKAPGQDFNKIFQHHTVKANGIKIHYVSGGKGDVILLLHGWPEDWYEWRKLMPMLVKNHQVIAVDLRGWGQTEKPDTGYDILTLAEDITQFIDVLHLKNVNIVGHDWGAPIGYATAAQHPDKVKSLAIIEASMPGIGGEKLMNFETKWSPLWFFPFLATPGLAEQMINGKEDIFYRWELTHMAANSKAAFTEADLQHYIKINTNPKLTHATYEYYKTVYVTTAQTKKLAVNKLNIPVLVVAGDKSLGPWLANAVKTSIAPNAQTVIIEDCGHVVPEEKPSELYKLLTAFYQK